MLQDKISQVSDIIKSELKTKENILIAIDGRCASGKTTFAKELQKVLSCNVIHMDNFFLRLEQRTEERLETAGENVDHERFMQEVMVHLKENKSFSYRPYNCHTHTFGEPIEVKANKITIIEGSYSCHQNLWDFYDFHIFIDVDTKTQLNRIVNRNGEQAKEIFQNKWIPLEEEYFNKFRIKEKCELQIYGK